MVGTPANSLNLTQAGLVKFDGIAVFSGVTVTDAAVLVGDTANGITSIGPLTNGQLVIGSTGLDPVAASLTAGTGITITPGAGSISIAAASGVATTYNADSGSATPSSNILTLAGGTNGIDTTASGSTVTFNFDVTEQPAIPTSVATDSGTATPALNVLTILGGTGCSTSGSSSTVTNDVDTSVPTTFTADSGTATPSSNNINILGGSNGIDTVASGATVTINFDVTEAPTIPTSFPTPSGTAIPALNALTFANGSGVSISGSGSTVTVAVNGSTVGQTITADTGGALSPTAGNWNILGGTNGIDTSGSGSTITLNFDVTEQPAIPTSIVTDSGTATPALNSFSIVGAGGITTSASGSTVTVTGGASALAWTEVTGTSQAMAVNNGYILNNSGLVTATLPATAAVGQIVAVVGKGAGGWRIAQNAGDQIRLGSSASTIGVTGHIDSTNQWDCIELICTIANDEWTARSVIGNISFT